MLVFVFALVISLFSFSYEYLIKGDSNKKNIKRQHKIGFSLKGDRNMILMISLLMLGAGVYWA